MAPQSITLFDRFARTETGLSEYGRGLFDWWNASARPEVARLREMVEGWFQRLPDHEKPALEAEGQSPAPRGLL
jgi:hypothetical protein